MTERIICNDNGGELREEIVRCKDCKEFTFGSDEYATVDWCDYWGAYVESPDGFCAWGERETDNKTGDFVTHGSGAKAVEQ